MASSSSLDKMPKMRSGRFDMNWAGKKPNSIAMNPEIRPSADSEKATGKPITMTNISAPNINGAMFCIVIIAAASRIADPSRNRLSDRRSA